jgi:hypothetical protein
MRNPDGKFIDRQKRISGCKAVKESMTTTSSMRTFSSGPSPKYRINSLPTKHRTGSRMSIPRDIERMNAFYFINIRPDADARMHAIMERYCSFWLQLLG